MAKKNIATHSRKKKALVLFRDNKLLEAKNLYMSVCQIDKMDSDVWVMLGIINRRLGSFQEAEASCRRALELKPKSAVAHQQLGAVLECQGKLTAALSCYRSAVRFQPDLVEAHYFLGNALRADGQLEESIESYREAVRLDPEYLEALSNMGAALMSTGNNDEALVVLQRANKIRPDTVQVLCNLAELFLVQDKLGEASETVKAALSVNPEFSNTHFLLGKIRKQQGDYDGAMESLDRALQLNPGHKPVLAVLAEILERRGEYQRCYDLLRPLVEEQPPYPDILTTFAALVPHLELQSEAIPLLEKSLLEPELEMSNHIDIHYSLGRYYDDVGEFDDAFKHYQQANTGERQLNAGLADKHDSLRLESEFKNWATDCGPEFWAQLPGKLNETERPVFVVGLPRSGTSLIEQILASHPDVFGAGELSGISEAANFLMAQPGQDSSFPQCMANASREMLNARAEHYLHQLSKISPDSPRVVDKMPTNFYYLGLIHLLFPRARIIHMVRDPLDTCLSIYFQKFGSTLGFTTDLQELGAYSALIVR